MSKLWKLKEWFSHKEVTHRLSAVLDEKVTSKDIFDLVFAGHLDVCVFLEHQYARPVAPSCMLHSSLPQLPGRERPPKAHKGPVIIGDGCALRDYEGRRAEEPLDVIASFSWENQLRIPDGYIKLTGFYKLDVEESSFLKGWFRSLSTKESEEYEDEFLTLDGYTVSTRTGEHYLIVESEKNGDGRLTYPSSRLPKMKSLAFHREAVSKLEDYLLRDGQNPEETAAVESAGELSSRREKSYLSVILAMVKMLDDEGALDSSSPYKAGNQIEAKLREIGISQPKHQTIGDILKAAIARDVGI